MNDTEAQADLNRWQWPALIVGLVGLAACLVGAFLNPTQFFQSYLFGYIFWLQISLGCMGLVMVHNLTGGGWGFMSRRFLEVSMLMLPLLALMLVPLLFGLPNLYIWARPEVVAADEVLQHKAAYLNIPFFLIRAGIYFVLWLGLAYLLNRWSLELEQSPNPELGHRLRTLSGLGLGILGLTLTFASFDWMMSLEPHWFSTIYGFMFAVGAVAAAFAFAILLVALFADRSPFPEVVSAGRFSDLGNFLLASVMLWAYISLSQYLIIWSGNLPEETPWYFYRTQGGWEWIGLFLIIFHFAIPFLVLLSRTVKRKVQTLAIVAGVVIFMRLVDLFWLIVPAFHPERLYIHWLDIVIPISLGGIWLAAFIWQLRRRLLLPLYDPGVKEERAGHGRREIPSHS